jgi:hypothetical protein
MPSVSPPHAPRPPDERPAGEPEQQPGVAPGPEKPPAPARKPRWWRKPLMVTTIIACLVHLPFTPAVPFFRMLERLSILRDPDKSWDYQPAELSLPIELVEMPVEPTPAPTEDNAVALPAPPPPGKAAPTRPAPAPPEGKSEADRKAAEKAEAKQRAEDKAAKEKQAAEEKKIKELEAKEKKAAAEQAAREAKEKAGQVKFAKGDGDDDEKPEDAELDPGEGDKHGDGTTPPPAPKKVAKTKAPKGPETVGLKGKLSDKLVGKPNVTVALWMPPIRAHALGGAVGELLACSPDWRPFLQQGIKPLDDIEGFMAVGPQISNSARMTVAVQHRLTEQQVHGAIDALVARSGRGGKWLNEVAARILVQRRDRVIFPHPRDMIFVSPPDAWESIHALKDPVSLPPPRGRSVAVTLLKPSRPLRKLGLRLPDRLVELHLDVFANQDGSVDLRIDFDDESEASAAADVGPVGKVLEQFFSDLSQVAQTVTSLGPEAVAAQGPLTLPKPDFAAVGKRLTATIRVLPSQSGKLMGILSRVICPKKGPGRAPAQAPPRPSAQPAGASSNSGG